MDIYTIFLRTLYICIYIICQFDKFCEKPQIDDVMLMAIFSIWAL